MGLHARLLLLLPLMLLPAGSISAAEASAGCFEHDVDYAADNDLAGVPGAAAETASACQGACAAHPGCHFWTWVAGLCQFKGNLMKTAPNPFWAMAPGFPTAPLRRRGAVSGPKVCPRQLSGAGGVRRVTTKTAFIEDMLRLDACAFDGLERVRERVDRCVPAAASAPAFAHWQLAHAGSRHARTYPRRAWEPCARRGRCVCHTTVRYGARGRWTQRPAGRSGAVACEAASFPPFAEEGAAPPLPRGSAGCECATGEEEGARSGEAAYLSVSMGRGGVPMGGCDVPLEWFSPQLDGLAAGWGEAAAHVALGLASRCVARLPRWTSVASWKQDAKGYRLPCASLTGAEFEAKVEEGSSAGERSDNVAYVYTQGVKHWRTMPMNISADVRGALKELFNVDVPEALQGGSAKGKAGNPDVPGWAASRWSHPCCMYMVTTQEAHRNFARFFLLVTTEVSRAVPRSADAAYCFLWKQDGCVQRYYGYLAEALWILWLYTTMRLLPLDPASPAAQCGGGGGDGVARLVTHRLYGMLSHADIDSAFSELFP